MAIKPRSQGQTAISVSMPADLLQEIDARAGSLNLNRSQYLAQLARQDVLAKGHMIIQEQVASPCANAKPVTYLKPKRRTNSLSAAVLRDIGRKASAALQKDAEATETP